jgi:hypothetical protein
MTLWRCDGVDHTERPCGVLYAVGLSRCPRCHSTEFHEEGSMPKISRNGGPTNAAAEAAPDGPEEGLATGGIVSGDTLPLVGEDVPPTVLPKRRAPREGASDTEGGEKPSPGNNSETSPEKLQTKPEPSETATPKPARKTASRSAKGRTQSSSAGTAAGDQTAPTSGSSDA